MSSTVSTRMSKRTVSLMSWIHSLSESHMLPSVPNYKHCNANKFEGEPLGFCCRGGKIHLSTPMTPLELMRLWSSSDADARHFRANVRYFNDHFSFTSLYCHLDRITTNI
jgi:hypothetical protein